MLDTSIKFSVVIPAYNEVRFLPDTLAALVRAMDALEMPGEVIVVDNNSDDGTAADYGETILAMPEMTEWTEGARAELEAREATG